jgi:16S rRNA (guanine527-N7)-methyltransferase
MASGSPKGPTGCAAVRARESPSDPLEPVWSTLASLRGHGPSDTERASFRAYLALILQWGRAQRLTGSREPESVARDFLADSLLFLPLLPRGRVGLVDIGAGAGLPGIPLAIVEPGLSVALVEARAKRVSFLRAVVRELGLPNAEVLEGRAETLVRERPDLDGRFDVAVARAVAGPEALWSLARPYLKPGGRLVASGPPYGSKLRDLHRLPEARWTTVPSPTLGRDRVFLIVQKEL